MNAVPRLESLCRARSCCPTASGRSSCSAPSTPGSRSSPGCRCSTASWQLRTRLRRRRLARARNAVRLSAGGGDRLPADRHPELDRTPADPGHAVAGAGRGVAGGPCRASRFPPRSAGWRPRSSMSAFWSLLIAATAREIVAGKNWRNLKVVGLVTLLLAGNIAFHLEAHLHGNAEYGIRIGIAAIVLLIAVIGGRIIPSFTRNWLARENPGRLPAPFGRFDAARHRRERRRRWRCGSSQPDRPADRAPRSSSPAVLQYRATGALGRRPHLARPPGPDPARRLRLRAARLPAGGARARSTSSPPAPASMPGRSARPARMTLAVMTRASLGHTGNALIASAGDAGDLCRRRHRRAGAHLLVAGTGLERVAAATFRRSPGSRRSWALP